MVGIALIPLVAWLFHEPAVLVFYSLALFLFLAVRTLVGLRGELAKADAKKSLIFDREFHFWQTRKTK